MTRQDRATLISQVGQAIWTDIIGRVLAPGIRMRSTDLGGRYAVSATPLREALRRLAAEGLLDIDPRSGASVTGVSRRDLDDTYWVRGMLEVMAYGRIGPASSKQSRSACMKASP